MKLISGRYPLSPMVPSCGPYVGLFARAIRRRHGSGLRLSGENSTGAGVEQLVVFTNPEKSTEKSSLYTVGLQWSADRVATGPILPGEAQGTLGPGTWSVPRTPPCPGPQARWLLADREVSCQGGSFPGGCFSSWIFNHSFLLSSLSKIPKKGSWLPTLVRGQSLSQCPPLPALNSFLPDLGRWRRRWGERTAWEP